MQRSVKNPAEAFGTGSVPKAVIKNAIPALIAMIMIMVYNLADVFFIGLTHDDLQVAAVSMASPVFMIFMSLGTLFGVGGTSVISRALGAGKSDYAKKVSAFCTWSCIAIGLVFMGLLWGFADKVCYSLGASEDSIGYAKSYLVITVSCGVFSMLSSCFSNIIRTEGEPMKSMLGSVIGNLINLVLDPIMILGFGWGITGAAIATVIGNLAAATYYFVYFFSGKSSLSINPKDFSAKDGIAKGVIGVGLSASLANLLSSVGAIVINGQLSNYPAGDMYVAGYGVTSKVMMIITLLGIGIGSGVQPMLGWCCGAKQRKRLTETIRFSTVFATAVCLGVSVICYAVASPVVKVFLTDESACDAGVRFVRILLYTGWLIGPFAICQNALQAMGDAIGSLLAAVFRQGIILIPCMFILQNIYAEVGLIWAQPVADVLSMFIVVGMMLRKIRKSM